MLMAYLEMSSLFFFAWRWRGWVFGGCYGVGWCGIVERGASWGVFIWVSWWFLVNVGGIGVVVGVLAWVLVRLGLGWCPVRPLVRVGGPGRSYRTGRVRSVRWRGGAGAMFIFWLP